ncbi:MAG: RNA 2',3'-cyclic phosphodiesterase [Acidimicrobiia bacterium]
MSSLARAFVAIRPPGRVLDELETAANDLHARFAGARWLPRDTWHLTLRFLGRVDDAEALAERLTALRGHPTVTLRLGGVGAFPTSSRARVLWVGCSEGSAGFTRLADLVERAVAPLGFGPPDHPARPHVSIARFGPPQDLRRALDDVELGTVGESWTAGSVGLYRSTTRAEGAVHTEVASFRLGR